MIAAMIDYETLDTEPTAQILTLGGIKFDPHTKEDPYDPFYVRVTMDDQDALGRTSSDSTIEWWGRQNADVQEEAFGEGGRVSLDEAMKQFHKWYWGCSQIWANGAIFDVAITENIYRQLGRTVPWNYYDVRDVRTMFKLGIDPKMDKSNLHNALADAYEQAKGVQHIYSELGLSK